MEAKKLKTTADLEVALMDDERLELINGEIVKRPMARFEHGDIQFEISSELKPYKKKSGDSDGWWFATEVSVQYNEHQRPSHDIAGWRKKHVPEKPKGVVNIIPDWVCEIASPSHESKDTVHIFNLLLNNNVPYYWIIWPEEKALIAYKLIDGKYTAIKSINNRGGRIKIEPFEEVEFDLDDVFGD